MNEREEKETSSIFHFELFFSSFFLDRHCSYHTRSILSFLSGPSSEVGLIFATQEHEASLGEKGLMANFYDDDYYHHYQDHY